MTDTLQWLQANDYQAFAFLSGDYLLFTMNDRGMSKEGTDHRGDNSDGPNLPYLCAINIDRGCIVSAPVRLYSAAYVCRFNYPAHTHIYLPIRCRDPISFPGWYNDAISPTT